LKASGKNIFGMAGEHERATARKTAKIEGAKIYMNFFKKVLDKVQFMW